MKMFLLDTVIIIDHLSGITKATKWLTSHPLEELAISVITRAEVLAGAGKSSRSELMLLLDSFYCFSLEPETADLAASIRQQKRLILPNAFQAAIAERFNLQLVTRNTKDFNQKEFPYVLVPYKVV